MRPIKLVLAVALSMALLLPAAIAAETSPTKAPTTTLPIEQLKKLLRAAEDANASPIQVPSDSVEPKDFVIASASEAVPGKPKWLLVPATPFMVGEGARSIAFGAPRGTASVEVIIVWLDPAGAIATAQKSIAIVSVDPPTPPNPPLPPGPTPGAKQQVAFYLESADLVKLPKAQRYVSSLAFRKALADAGHVFVRCFDPDTPVPAEFAPWKAAAAGKQIPLLLVAPMEGGPIRAVPLPADEAAAMKSISGTSQGSK